jgi:hypothetical protein
MIPSSGWWQGPRKRWYPTGTVNGVTTHRTSSSNDFVSKVFTSYFTNTNLLSIKVQDTSSWRGT